VENLIKITKKYQSKVRKRIKTFTDFKKHQAHFEAFCFSTDPFEEGALLLGDIYELYLNWFNEEDNVLGVGEPKSIKNLTSYLDGSNKINLFQPEWEEQDEEEEEEEEANVMVGTTATGEPFAVFKKDVDNNY